MSSIVTDTSGNYSFTNIAIGDYTVGYMKSGFITSQYTPTFSADGQTSTNHIVLYENLLQGTISHGGTGFMGATITASVAGATYTTTTTTDSGYYRFVNLPVGANSLEVSNPGYQTVTSISYSISAGVITTADASLISTDATLKASSTVKGETISDLGTPNATLGAEIQGAVTITIAAAAADTTNGTTFITLFDKTDLGATVKL
jgi:hypothetical protein